jgi:hypothetical protein
VEFPFHNPRTAKVVAESLLISIRVQLLEFFFVPAWLASSSVLIYDIVAVFLPSPFDNLKRSAENPGTSQYIFQQ